MNIIKSPLDDRQYKYTILPNMLKVVLISDPTEHISSVSMLVNVGSMYDPTNFQGLAHFLEHMLFMGNQKYPIENYYNKYITEHGGRTNAYTAPDHTNYFFNIQSEYLEHILDVFSHFFIDPLLTDDAVDREVNAVNSEHEKNLMSDIHRFRGVLHEIANPHSYFHKFSTGNLYTLNKDGLLDALKNFHKKYYSANQMYLCIAGSDSIEKLESLANKYFLNIPNKEINISLPYQELFTTDTTSEKNVFCVWHVNPNSQKLVLLCTKKLQKQFCDILLM